VHFFPLATLKNKLLTRDNPEKRRSVDDTTCVFCTEKESICHLFFGCVVARRAWSIVSHILGVETMTDYELVARL
jgi:hypothetical protein